MILSSNWVKGRLPSSANTNLVLAFWGMSKQEVLYTNAFSQNALKVFCEERTNTWIAKGDSIEVCSKTLYEWLECKFQADVRKALGEL